MLNLKPLYAQIKKYVLSLHQFFERDVLLITEREKQAK
jgi:hypothetical protein